MKKRYKDRLWEVYRLSPDAGFGFVMVALIICICGLCRAAWGLMRIHERTGAK